MTDLALRYRHLAVNLGPRGAGALAALTVALAWLGLGMLILERGVTSGSY